MKDNTQKKEGLLKEVIIFIVCISILVVGVVSVSFVTFTNANKKNKAKKVVSGEVNMTYTDTTNGISINNAMPTTDDLGKVLSGENEYFDFSITSEITGDTSIIYEIAAIKDKTSTVSDENIKLYLEKEKSGTYTSILEPTAFVPIKEKSDIGSPVNSMILLKETVKEDTVDNYRFRMWLSDQAILSDVPLTYSVKINVYGKTK